MEKLANWMAQVVDNMDNEDQLARIASEVKELCSAFPWVTPGTAPNARPSGWRGSS